MSILTEPSESFKIAVLTDLGYAITPNGDFKAFTWFS